MFIAYCSILIAACLPYLWTVVAKTGAPGYNNKDPRAWIAKQDSYRVRNAYNAHLNAFEAFPAFAVAVLMAQFAQVDPQRVAWLAMTFIAFRILHGIFYIAALQYLRSLAWMGGLACVIGLMVSAALRVGG
ncbi:MAPEG family protein [Thermomonas paludicola]|uniref:MAPEG family protein n=1 Tax=Thermomonas paludicola TaxID=2884874 RepID=UPI0021140220|nr:MAPEG family protein [Thermomonas paludicola]